jgi:hypothetical protein
MSPFPSSLQFKWIFSKIVALIVTGVLENRLRGLLPRVYFRRDYVASHRFLDASEVGSRDYDVSRSFSSSGEVATLY